MAGKYTMRSKEEKLAIVKRNLAGETSRSLERETGCSHRLIQEWTRKYLAEGEAGLEVKKKPGNLNCTPFVRQYDILSNRWGDLLCQEENQTNDTRRNSRSWS